MLKPKSNVQSLNSGFGLFLTKRRNKHVKQRLFIIFTISFELKTVKKYNSLVSKRWVFIEKKALFIYIIYYAIDNLHIRWGV